MPLNVIVVMDPIAHIKIAKDTTFAMLLEAQRRGHALHYVRPGGLALEGGVAVAWTAPLQVRDDPAGWYELGAFSRTEFGPGQIVLMRKDPPVDAEYVYDTQVLDVARIAGALVVSQIALALTLLVAAGLTVKSFANLLRIDPGFDPRDVLTVSLPLPGARYANPVQQRQSVGELVLRLENLPGVQSVGGASMLPLGPCCNGMPVTIEGRPAPAPGQGLSARSTVVAGRYFEAMRIRVRRGRVFNASDARVAIPLIRWWPQQPLPPRFDEPQPAPVAVISETMAQQFWPNEDPIGKRFQTLFSPWVTVIGVVADVRQSGLLEPPMPQMYLSDLQEPSGALTMVLRTHADPLAVAPAIRQQVRAVDAALPIGAIQTMDDVIWNSIGRPRFNAVLLGTSGFIALLLAVLGVYGLISYAVERRTHEIGIRRALGAQTHDVLRMVLGQAFTLVAIGIVIGAAGAFALTRLLVSMLVDVRPTDPSTFVAVAALLAGVALFASYLPGRRATRVDPTTALRSE